MKYIAIAGYMCNGVKDEFTQCIGVFSNCKEAYGEAVLYLNDLIMNENTSEQNNITISPIYSLDMDTGHYMHTVGDPNREDYVQILFYDDENDHGKHFRET